MDTDNPSLTLTRRIDAPPARVFAAWTEPRLIARWWQPVPADGADAVRAEIDLRVGGRYRIVIRGADGAEHDVGGEYEEIEPDRRLVFTWAWRSTPTRVSRVRVTLAPDGGGTRLTLTHERFADETARDRHRGGWTRILDALADTFAGPASQRAH
ncbi:MAG: SRPBCC domain-containing protein [Gammaproteobacteria bacterium]